VVLVTRWLVIVPEGDEVKYARDRLLNTDKVIVVDLDALTKKFDDPLSSFGASPALLGVPIYDVEIEP
jgi:hypothetical protein